MDLNSLPKNASSLKFRKFDQNILGLCLSYKINPGLSLRKTAQALHDIHGIKISHQQVANYLKTAAVCIKPFVDNYNYDAGTVFTADETYIKIRGIKGYIKWYFQHAGQMAAADLSGATDHTAAQPDLWLFLDSEPEVIQTATA